MGSLFQTWDAVDEKEWMKDFAIELTSFLWHMPDDVTEGVAEHSSRLQVCNHQFACPSYSLHVQLLWYLCTTAEGRKLG